METLVAVAHQQRGHYAGQSKSSHFSSPSRGFRGINCRAFHSGAAAVGAIGIGILPSPPPPPARSNSSPEPKSPQFYSEPPNHKKRSKPMAISPMPFPKGTTFGDDAAGAQSELWAGPAFSNSPPPSSLPIPNFSLRQKRSISLELPVARTEQLEVWPHAKSVPSSPTKLSSNDFFLDTATATENLRRILHLDVTDD